MERSREALKSLHGYSVHAGEVVVSGRRGVECARISSGVVVGGAADDGTRGCGEGGVGEAAAGGGGGGAHDAKAVAWRAGRGDVTCGDNGGVVGGDYARGGGDEGFVRGIVAGLQVLVVLTAGVAPGGDEAEEYGAAPAGCEGAGGELVGVSFGVSLLDVGDKVGGRGVGLAADGAHKGRGRGWRGKLRGGRWDGLGGLRKGGGGGGGAMVGVAWWRRDRR